jgi:magnesium-transporting ATPase (P-type)
MQRQVDDMAAKGQRVLGFAYRYWDALPSFTDNEKQSRICNFWA